MKTEGRKDGRTERTSCRPGEPSRPTEGGRVPPGVRSPAGPSVLPSVRPSVSLASLARAISTCDLCPRLRAHCREIGRVRKREFASDTVPEQHVVEVYDKGASGALWELVQTLPRKARAVVVLRYYEQLSEAETAEILGISVGTVKSQTSRALAMLRERAPEMNPRHTEEQR